MTVLITLTIPPGGIAGPFNLYSDTDGYVLPFETNISALVLTAGFISFNVPPGTTIIRVRSIAPCTNYIDIPINLITTTTTTSSSSTTTSTTTVPPTSTTTSTSSSTSTSTTTVPPTSTTTSTSSSTTSTTTSSSSTTTSTTTVIACNCLTFVNTDENPHLFGYTTCDNVELFNIGIGGNETVKLCGSLPSANDPSVIITVGDPCILGACQTTTTTTTIPPTTTTTTTVCPCVEYVSIIADGAGTFNYEDCFGTPKSVAIVSGPNVFIGLDDPACLNRNSLSATVSFTVEAFGPCCIPTPSTSTTTSTTTGIPTCAQYLIDPVAGEIHTVQYTPCGGSTPLTINLGELDPSITICAQSPLISDNFPADTTEGAGCTGYCFEYSYDSGDVGGDLVVTDCDTGVVSTVPYGPGETGTGCATNVYSTGGVLFNIIGPCPF
jgi:hypothetical protein